VWPNFIASTYKELVLVQEGKVHTLHKGEGQYYGITWSKDSIFVAHKKDDYPPGPEVSILNTRYKVMGVTPGNFPDVHQILYRKGLLYITSTDTNSIDVYNGRDIKSKNWTEHITGVNHINSIYHDGKGFWSCHHNLVSRGDHTYSDLVYLGKDMSSIKSKIRVGRDLHNVFVSGNLIYTLSSADEELLEISLETGEIQRRTKIGMWPRGFAATEKYFLIGVSTKIDRSNRPDGRSEVHLVDRKSMKVLDILRIGGVGVMHEIRVTSELDLAHNGIPYPGARL
jgi:hypothetical protein